MMILRGAVVLAFAATLMMEPVYASHHDDPCKGTVGGMTIDEGKDLHVPTVGDGFIVPLVDPDTGPFYLDVRHVVSERYLFYLSLYQEANGTAGLQRGGRALIPDLPGTAFESSAWSPGPPISSSSDTSCA